MLWMFVVHAVHVYLPIQWVYLMLWMFVVHAVHVYLPMQGVYLMLWMFVVHAVHVYLPMQGVYLMLWMFVVHAVHVYWPMQGVYLMLWMLVLLCSDKHKEIIAHSEDDVLQLLVRVLNTHPSMADVQSEAISTVACLADIGVCVCVCLCVCMCVCVCVYVCVCVCAHVCVCARAHALRSKAICKTIHKTVNLPITYIFSLTCLSAYIYTRTILGMEIRNSQLFPPQTDKPVV